MGAATTVKVSAAVALLSAPRSSFRLLTVTPLPPTALPMAAKGLQELYARIGKLPLALLQFYDREAGVYEDHKDRVAIRLYPLVLLKS